MSLIAHAEAELDTVGMTADSTGMNGMMREHILRMVGTFADEGHSGFSAAYAASLLQKLFQFEPLTPLMGDDSEWVEVSDNFWQNKRCSRVFRDADGAYDINGRVFRDPDGSCYTNGASRVAVTFPYTPTTEYVERAA